MLFSTSSSHSPSHLSSSGLFSHSWDSARRLFSFGELWKSTFSGMEGKFILVRCFTVDWTVFFFGKINFLVLIVRSTFDEWTRPRYSITIDFHSWPSCMICEVGKVLTIWCRKLAQIEIQFWGFRSWCQSKNVSGKIGNSLEMNYSREFKWVKISNYLCRLERRACVWKLNNISYQRNKFLQLLTPSFSIVFDQTLSTLFIPCKRHNNWVQLILCIVP